LNGVDAFILGLIQGLTEFLPVSSSGHLVLSQELLGIHQEGLRFEVAVHAATLVSVLVFYRRRVLQLARGTLRREAESLRYVGKLAVATVPAVAAYLLAGDWLEAQFELPSVVGVCLIATGGILWTTRRTLGAARLPEPGWRGALWIGCAQAVAILPGISRSGSTVAVALALGVAPAAAAEFSFLMSVIVIAGAAFEKLPGLSTASAHETAALAIGAVAALVAGVAAIWLFVRLLRTRHLYRFAYYTWAVGALFLVWLAVRA
jgi:undecaprenyl-diphosphatase